MPDPHATIEVKAYPVDFDPKSDREIARTFRTFHYRINGHVLSVDVGVEETTGNLILRCHQVQPALQVDLSDLGEELIRAMIRETVELEEDV